VTWGPPRHGRRRFRRERTEIVSPEKPAPGRPRGGGLGLQALKKCDLASRKLTLQASRKGDILSQETLSRREMRRDEEIPRKKGIVEVPRALSGLPSRVRGKAPDPEKRRVGTIRAPTPGPCQLPTRRGPPNQWTRGAKLFYIVPGANRFGEKRVAPAEKGQAPEARWGGNRLGVFP